ncbi:MAG: hypothetical protein ACYDDP_00120 [Acidithiobacillus sp.]|jgi:hypothetical protein|nr:hypothetical protein [Acidithiobacillus sp.]
MSVSAGVTIIAIVMIIILLIIAVTAVVLIRTQLRLERLLARVEQDIGPLVFDAKVALADIKHITQTGRVQMGRVDSTLRYLSQEIMDTTDTLVRPIHEMGLWYRALRTGWRYFSRKH